MARAKDVENNGADSTTGFKPQPGLVDYRTGKHTSTRDSKTTSENDIDDNVENDDLRLTWRERIRHFTWTWFCLTMATGGIANVIHVCPLRFHGLYTIGLVFMFLNILIFICNCIAISLRFFYWPSTFRASLLHPTESLFVPAPVISLAIILITITEYGTDSGKAGPWLASTMTVFFWFYVALSVVASIGVFLIMYGDKSSSLPRRHIMI